MLLFLEGEPFALPVVAVDSLTVGADLHPLDAAGVVHQDEDRAARLQAGQGRSGPSMAIRRLSSAPGNSNLRQME